MAIFCFLRSPRRYAPRDDGWCRSPRDDGEGYSPIGIKSSHAGFVSLINASLRARDQLFICFSRAMADIIVGCLSTISRTFIRYFLVNSEPIPFLCSRTLCRILEVTPVYNTVFLALVSMYTHGSIIFLRHCESR